MPKSTFRRLFRLYGKKRGHRYSLPDWFGWAGEGVFFALMVLLGLLGVWLVVRVLALPDWEVAHRFRRCRGTVLDVRVGRRAENDRWLFRPEVEVEYEVRDQVYRIWTYDIQVADGGGYQTDLEQVKRALHVFRRGKQYWVYYDPDDPARAVLIRGSAWWLWVAALVPASFLLLGTLGLVQCWRWWRSTRRLPAIPQTPTASEQALPPGIPSLSDVTDSPGTRLAYRLPGSDAKAWSTVLWFSSCIAWNVLAGSLGVAAVRGHLQGRPDWTLTVFVVLFLIAGLFWMILLLRRVIITGAVGPTIVEISELPLRPGQDCQVYILQQGRLKAETVRVWLECHERATFCQGTDTRTETRCVYRQQLLEQQTATDAGSVFEAVCCVQIPWGAMHSFKSPHNEINWRIVVEAHNGRRRLFRRIFPLVVHP